MVFSTFCQGTKVREVPLKLINGIVGLALLIALLENREPYVAMAAIIMLLLWSVSLRMSKGLGFKRLEWAILICLGYWVASYFWSTGDFQNFISFGFIRQDGALLVSYTAFLGLLGWPLRPIYYRRFWLLFLFLCSLLALPGLVYCLHLTPIQGTDFLERLGIVGGDVWGRKFTGFYEAHNTTGGVYALASVLALALLREAPLTPRMRQFVRVEFLICLGGLLFSYSRGAYLGFLVGAALILPLRRVGTTIRAALLIGIPVVLLGLMTSSLFSRMDSITDPNYGTNADRLNIWGEALDDFAASPVIGIGYGRFNDDVTGWAGVKGLVWVGVRGLIRNNDSHAHNSYLHFLAEGGIIGFWLTLRIWWCAWAELSFYQEKRAKSWLQGFYKAAKACVLCILMMSVTEHMLGKGSVVIVVLSVIGMLLAASRAEERLLRQAEQGTPPLLHVRLPAGELSALTR